MNTTTQQIASTLTETAIKVTERKREESLNHLIDKTNNIEKTNIKSIDISKSKHNTERN